MVGWSNFPLPTDFRCRYNTVALSRACVMSVLAHSACQMLKARLQDVRSPSVSSLSDHTHIRLTALCPGLPR